MTSELAGATAPAPSGGAALAALRFTDVVVVVLATPFALAFGAPVLGYLAGAAAWLVQRAVGELVRRRSLGDPRRALMANMVFSMGRVWVLALIILLVGKLAARQDGLTCALVLLVAFTIYFSMTLILRSSTGRAQSS